MTMKIFRLSLLIAGLLLATPLAADTVDFTQLPLEQQGSPTAVVDGVTFSSATDLYNLSATHFPNAGGAICGFDPDSFSCHNDLTVKFGAPVRRLRLSVIGYDQADIVSITLYRRGVNLGSVDVTQNGRYRLGSFGKVSRIVIDVSPSAHNIAFGKFNFVRPVTARAAKPDPTKTGHHRAVKSARAKDK